MGRIRDTIAGAVLLLGAGLMVGGERLWNWAADGPVDDEALFVAVSTGDVQTARRAIAGGAALEASSPASHTPLATAAGGGDEAMVACLLAAGAKVDAFSGDGTTALTYAATISGDVGVCRALLDANADPNGDSSGQPGRRTPLIAAIVKGNEAVVELLLNAGADPNRYAPAPYGDSPLTIAASSDEPNATILRRLIAAGADVNRPDGAGVTPLRAALDAGNADLAYILRDAARASLAANPAQARASGPSRLTTPTPPVHYSPSSGG